MIGLIFFITLIVFVFYFLGAGTMNKRDVIFLLILAAIAKIAVSIYFTVAETLLRYGAL